MQTKSEPTEVISPEKEVENLISLGCQLNIWVFTKKKELATINSDVMSCNKDFTVGTRKKTFFSRSLPGIPLLHCIYSFRF